MPTQEGKRQSDALVKILILSVMMVVVAGLAIGFSAFSSPSGPDTRVRVVSFDTISLS